MDPLLELSVQFSLRWHRAVEPGMSEHLVQGRPRRGIQLHHVHEQVFELIAERSDLLVDLPEDLGLVARNQPVARISDFGSLERLALSDHHEQDNGNGEQIRMLTAVPALG